MTAAAARGAVVGVVAVVPIAVITAWVERGRPGEPASGWRIPLFFGLLAAFCAAGWVAGRRVPTSRLTVGILAGLGTFVLWLPIRVLIWTVRADDRGLVRGTDAVLRPGQLFTAALLACAFGLLGGLVGGRRPTASP